MRYNPAEWSAKLRDPRWQKKRLETLENYGWACCRCYDEASTLHIHHLFYDGREPWDYDPGELTVLCDSCHEREHDLRKDYEHDLLLTLKRRGFFSDDLANLVSAFAYVNINHCTQVTSDIIKWILLDDKRFLKLEEEYFEYINEQLKTKGVTTNDHQAQTNP